MSNSCSGKFVRLPGVRRRRVHAALTGVEYSCNEWGLRHQLIFLLCQQCEDVVRFTVSQEGDVKAVQRIVGSLHAWGGILD